MVPVSGQAVSASARTCAVYEEKSRCHTFWNLWTEMLQKYRHYQAYQWCHAGIAKNQAVHRKDNQMASGQIFGPMALVSLRVIASYSSSGSAFAMLPTFLNS